MTSLSLHYSLCFSLRWMVRLCYFESVGCGINVSGKKIHETRTVDEEVPSSKRKMIKMLMKPLGRGNTMGNQDFYL